MKTRIREVLTSYGSTRFIPEKKVLWWWKETDPGHVYSSLEVCKFFVKHGRHKTINIYYTYPTKQ